MSEARYLVGDVFDRMAKLPDGSVDLIVTSPPFLALRSYLPADHPDKTLEIGSEATPAAFLSTLLALTREWRRLLAPHGSLCVELGDTYSGSGGAGGDYAADGLREGQPMFDGAAKRRRKDNGYPERDDTPRPPRNGRRSRALDEADGILAPRGRGGPEQRDRQVGWPLDKSLCGIPDAYMLSLIYGWNMLDPTDNGHPRWRARNKIVWHRPNPPVGALGDKVRPSTSYVTVACTSRTRWFDLDAERTAHRYPDRLNDPVNQTKPPTNGSLMNDHPITNRGSEAGAPPLDCWTIPTAPYQGSHYATFPPALPRKLINLMCPRQVCVVCGEPRRRIVDDAGQPEDRRQYRGIDGRLSADTGITRNVTTIGWTDCGCGCDCYPYHNPELTHNDNYRRGVVLDPFAGSGTTLMAASELGRDSIGIDLDERNLELARQRCGMFLTEPVS